MEIYEELGLIQVEPFSHYFGVNTTVRCLMVLFDFDEDDLYFEDFAVACDKFALDGNKDRFIKTVERIKEKQYVQHSMANAEL